MKGLSNGPTFNVNKTSSTFGDLILSESILIASSAMTDSYCCTNDANKSIANKSTSLVDADVARSELSKINTLRSKCL